MKALSRFFQWLISSTLAVLGFSACDFQEPAMYGTPIASYSIKAKVLDSKQKPIPEIKVRITDNGFPIDSLYTNATGEVLFEFGDCMCNVIGVECEDVDGDKNGNFEDKIVIIQFENSDYKGGDGWYRGKAEKDITIEMENKTEE